jgi:Cof subfamily protein (haloacid dehalogenase superfamily)
MPIRLIAIDLDGTLVNSQGQIAPANREAVVAAARRGVQIVIVTGRRFHSARPFIEQIPQEVILISSNGARIGKASGEVYYRNFLPVEVARQVIQAAHDYQVYAVVIFDMNCRGQLLMHADAALDGPVGWYMRNSRDYLLQTPELDMALTADPIQVTFGGPPEKIEPVEAVLRSSPVASFCNLTWTKYLARNLSLLDVMNRGCSKGVALAWWAKSCGIGPQEVMAIGDNFNDIEMLQFAGLPVLMANHSFEAVRDGWKLTRSNDEDGVAAAIERYVLSNPERQSS